MSPSLLMLTEAQGGFGQVEMELRGVETEPACLFSGRVGSQLVLGVRAGLPITAAIAARLCTAPNRPTTPAE